MYHWGNNTFNNLMMVNNKILHKVPGWYRIFPSWVLGHASSCYPGKIELINVELIFTDDFDL